MIPDLSPYEFFVGGTLLVISVYILGAFLKARQQRRQTQVQYIVAGPGPTGPKRNRHKVPLFNFLLICALALLVYIIAKDIRPTPVVVLQPLDEIDPPSLNSMELLEDENGVVYTPHKTE